ICCLQRSSGRYGLLFPRLEVLLDFLKGLTLGFGKEECHYREVDDSKSGKEKKHRRITIFADDGKKDSSERCRDELVDDERDTHSIGADACGHEFGESEPDADAGPDGEGGHEEVETEGDEPAVARGWHGSDDSALDFERRCPRGFEVTERIFK